MAVSFLCNEMNSRVLTTLTLTILVPAAAMSFSPQENPNGVRWGSVSSEAWTGSAQTNPSGVTTHLAATFDPSIDTINANNVVGHIGLLDPIPGVAEPTPTVPPMPTDTPILPVTSTPTPGKTESPTPSQMPTEIPLPTDTPTVIATVTETPEHQCGSYDLNGDGQVDSQDLLLLIRFVRDTDLCGDFNDDGQVNQEDIFLLGQNWNP